MSQTLYLNKLRKAESLFGQMRFWYRDKCYDHECILAPFVLCFWDLKKCLDPKMVTNEQADKVQTSAKSLFSSVLWCTLQY